MKPSILLVLLLVSLVYFVDLSNARGLTYEEGCGVEHLNQSCGEPYPCCSNEGHCGNTIYYCGKGHCQHEFGTCWDNVPPPPPPPSPPPPSSPPPPVYEEGCGVEHRNQSCGEPYPCCSVEGHCGNSIYYCAKGHCQPKFGTCWDNVPPPPSPPTLEHIYEEGCGVENLNQSCSEPYPCCSNEGHCGNTIYYCGKGRCQHEFGTCWDNVPPPPPPPSPPPPSSPPPPFYEEGCGAEHHNQSCVEPYPCCSVEGHCGNSVYYCAKGNCQPLFGTCWDNVPLPPTESNEVFENSLIGNVIDGMELVNQF